MAEQAPNLEQNLPEQVVAAQTVGQIPVANLPWLSDAAPGQGVNVSEFQFADGSSIYLASAIEPKLQKIAEKARARDPKLSEGERYTPSDRMFLLAAQLEANGQAIQSSNIAGVRGDISSKYQGMRLKAYKEGLKANTRRVYYGLTSLQQTGFQPSNPNASPSPDGLFIIRLALTDKNHQVETLARLTGQSIKTLRNQGAGK
jgi:hypothetical protein